MASRLWIVRQFLENALLDTAQTRSRKDDEVRAEFAENLHQRECGAAEFKCHEVCGVTMGWGGAEERATWWWNEGVRKKDAFKVWQRSGREDDKKLYKLLSKIARREWLERRVMRGKSGVGT